MLTYSRVVFATIDAAKLIKKIFRAIIFPVAEFRYNVSDGGIIFPIAEFRTADAKKKDREQKMTEIINDKTPTPNDKTPTPNDKTPTPNAKTSTPNDKTPTPHIGAKKGDFAKTVLMPGDPMRAKFIAENYLENAVLVNKVRGAYGYTGFYKGKPVSVMTSGMGQPSMGIYSYELFRFYGVENIIRIGSCGSFDKDLHLKDLVIALGACSSGNFAEQYGLPGEFAPIADFGLAKLAAEECEKRGVNHKIGNVLCSEYFYDDGNRQLEWTKMGVLGVEMESAALYCTAARLGKKALCICAVSDSFVYPDETLAAKEREKSFDDLIGTALEIAAKIS